MEKNRYRSYENQHGSVWLNLGLWGELHVRGNSEAGYRIQKIGRPGSNSTEFWNFVTVECGDANVWFSKRKDAENFALVLALNFNNDIQNKQLLDPTYFFGMKSESKRIWAKRDELFWCDVSQINLSEGWDMPEFNTLVDLPSEFHECFPIDEDTYEYIDQRGYEFEEVLDKLHHYYLQNFLTPNLEMKLHQIFEEILTENADMKLDPALRGYACLILISRLRESLPFDWVFPGQKDYLIDLIPKLWKGLPDEIINYLKSLET
jgi:hypothetical protein